MLNSYGDARMFVRAGRGAPEPVLAKLTALAPLSPIEAALVRNLSAHREQHAAGTEIYGEGSSLRPRVVLSGWACRMRMLPDGRRQIFAFLLPGDAIAVGPALQPVGACTVVALTRTETADATALREAAVDIRTGLGQAYALASCIEESQALDHMTRLGRQTALERTAHLLLELRNRLESVGMADGRRFPLPLTQEILADALGLSVVHVNRTLQQLRREGSIELKSGWVELLEAQTLADRADWIPPQPARFAESRSFAARRA